MGWLTVLDDVLAFVLTGLAAAKGSRIAAFWAIICLCMLLLAGGKAFDLQSLMADMLRSVARHSEWYEGRRPYQEIILILIAVTALAVGLVLGFRERRRRWDVKLAGFALVALLGLFGAQTVSLHGIDAAFQFSIFGLSAHGLAENAFILIIAASAASVVGSIGSRPRDRKRASRKAS